MCLEDSIPEKGLYLEEFNAKWLAPIPSSCEGVDWHERNKMILENRESARKIAHSLLRRWRVALPIEDIESLVDLTLCEAANRYLPEQGASFMTFFFYYVRGNFARNIGKLARISQVFINPGEALETLSNAQSNQNNQGVISEEWSACAHDRNVPEQLLIDHEKVVLCNKALSDLDPIDREVLLRLFDGEESLITIAKSLGYSRCHISRIKKRALKQFQASFASISGDLPKTVTELPLAERNSVKRRGRHRRELAPTLLQRKQLTNKRRCA